MPFSFFVGWDSFSVGGYLFLGSFLLLLLLLLLIFFLSFQFHKKMMPLNDRSKRFIKLKIRDATDWLACKCM